MDTLYDTGKVLFWKSWKLLKEAISPEAEVSAPSNTMAVLKDHMLVEIAVDLCERAHPVVPMLVIETLPGVENFMLSGKGPFRVFSRLVTDEVNINSVTSDTVQMEYCRWSDTLRRFVVPYKWQLKSVFLNTVFIKEVRRLKMGAFEWLVAFPRTGYCQKLAEKKDLNLYVDNDRFHDWATILKTFPRICQLMISSNNFAPMLFAAPKELGFLQIVTLRDHSSDGDEDILRAHEALSNHRNKCPNLTCIGYNVDSSSKLKFPNIDPPISTIKWLQIKTRSKCCTPLDFSFLTAAEKMYPSLVSVKLTSLAVCLCRSDVPQRLKTIDSLYQSVESLTFGHPIDISYDDHFLCYEKDVNEIRQFFATKGTIFGKRYKFAVKTSAPRKNFTYRVTLYRIKNKKKL